MKRETMKSIILFILIGFSLLLTVTLWNYQPSLEPLDEDGVIEEMEINGEVRQLSSLVVPEQFVFHEADAHYSYQNPNDLQSMYREMHEWPLLNIEVSPGPAPNFDTHDQLVEIIFATKIPTQVLANIFKVDDPSLFSGSNKFDRIIFAYNNHNQSGPAVEVWAMNSGQGAKVHASVPESNGRKLIEELNDKDQLVEQIIFSEVDPALENNHITQNIYLPKNPVVYPIDILTSNSIPVKPLKNVLFPDPRIVSSYSTSSVDQRLQDDFRRLDVLENQTRMEYIYQIPNRPIRNFQSQYELLTQSLDFINVHKGWTDPFRLAGISSEPDHVEYQMYYNQLPILSSPGNIANMSVTYEENQVQEYIRPLIDLKPYTFSKGSGSELSDQTKELISGEKVARYLINSRQYETEQIENIKIGYSLIEQVGGGLAYHLIPQWFVLERGSWKRIPVKELAANEGGA